MIASVFTNHTMFLQMTIFMILPMSYISGIWYTKQAMVSNELRIFSSILPSTIPAEAMRDVLTRGWDLSHTSVQLAIVVSVVWILLFNSTALVAVKMKSK